MCEGGSVNAFKLAEDEGRMAVSSGRAIPSKRANLPSYMIAITGTMGLQTTKAKRSPTDRWRGLRRTAVRSADPLRR